MKYNFASTPISNEQAYLRHHLKNPKKMDVKVRMEIKTGRVLLRKGITHLIQNHIKNHRHPPRARSASLSSLCGVAAAAARVHSGEHGCAGRKRGRPTDGRAGPEEGARQGHNQEEERRPARWKGGAPTHASSSGWTWRDRTRERRGRPVDRQRRQGYV